MLTDGEDESIVEREVRILGLCDVEVVALGVGCGMEGQEGIGWIGAGVSNGERKC